MKTFNLIQGYSLSTVLLGAFLTHCSSGIEGSGKKDTVTRFVNQFSTIVNGGDLDYSLVLTEQPEIIDNRLAPSSAGNRAESAQDSVQISIEGDDNLLPLLSTTVRNTKLFIQPKEELDPALQIVITVHSGNLDRFINRGEGNIVISGINTAEFTLLIEGEGDHTLRGITDELVVDITGSGNVKGYNLEANYAFVDIFGSGDVNLCVYEVLQVNLMGSGDVTYDCNPYSVGYEITGSGFIEPR